MDRNRRLCDYFGELCHPGTRLRLPNCQLFPEENSGLGTGVFRQFFGRPLGNNCAAMRAGFGAEIYDVIRGLDDIQVVFNYDQSVASTHKLMKKTQERGDIIEMQASCRFVEDQERVPAVFLALSEVADELPDVAILTLRTIR